MLKANRSSHRSNSTPGPCGSNLLAVVKPSFSLLTLQMLKAGRSSHRSSTPGMAALLACHQVPPGRGEQSQRMAQLSRLAKTRTACHNCHCKTTATAQRRHPQGEGLERAAIAPDDDDFYFFFTAFNDYYCCYDDGDIDDIKALHG